MALRRLKNESTEFPPGGLQFFQPEFGWRNTKAATETLWSWDGLVMAITNLRRANAARYPKLATDRATIIRQISEQNAFRIANMEGAETYLAPLPAESPATGGSASNPQMGQRIASSLKGAAGRVELLARGGASLGEWLLKENGTPVAPELAEARAGICVVCPKNNMEGLDSWFTKPAAALIKRKLEARNDLKLATTHDAKLGTCEACLCQLHLAVHQPLAIKLKNLSASAKANLDPKCWALHETP